MTFDSIVNSMLVKTSFFTTATFASVYTTVVAEAHTYVAFLGAILSLIFALLNIVTWFEGRKQMRMDRLPKALAISTTKLEKDKKDEHS